jgi:large subunit ribosomal protein L4
MNKQKSLDAQKKDIGRILLPADLSFLEEEQETISEQGYSIWIRTLLQNWRQGTVAVKGRSDVSFSNKKPWKQKGTGRARAGSPRSPLWRGGGVTFGPQARVKTLKVNKKLKKGVLRTLLLHRLHAGLITVLDWELSQDVPKTALAHKVLLDAGFSQEQVTLFLPIQDVASYGSFVNIPLVRVLFFDQANAFDISRGDRWIILKKDIELFKKMVSQWI